MGKVAGKMIRARRLIEFALMALETIQVCQEVVSPPMTGFALDSDMFAGELKFRRRMIERRRTPRVHRMACCAGGRKKARHVLGVRSAVEIGLMTVDAVLMKAGKDVVDVTACARYGLVRADQGESRICVIEGRRRPHGRRMTLVARVRKISGRVIRVRRLLVVRLVAHVTVGVRKLEVVVHVAR